MKTLLLILLISIFGCAEASIKQTKYDKAGKITSVTEAYSKRPIFASNALAWTSTTGNLNSASSVDINQMLMGLLSGYLATQAPIVGPAITGGN